MQATAGQAMLTNAINNSLLLAALAGPEHARQRPALPRGCGMVACWAGRGR